MLIAIAHRHGRTLHRAHPQYRARMPWAPKSLKHWVLVLGWMLLISLASTDAMSAEHTSRFIVPLVRWLRPNISNHGLETVQFLVRKAAHLTEYAVLAILFRRALRGSLPTIARGTAVGIVAVCFCYASLDEFHQSFVPSRTAAATDVFIDMVGAAIGLIAYELVVRTKRRAQFSGATRR